jgi:glucosamine--fructose-6-phosphate aminotransferase (isomerizing)
MSKYKDIALCREMLETIELVSGFRQEVSLRFAESLKQKRRICITGEGSSRIFPGKHFRELSLTNGADYDVISEGANQALDYQLANYVVFGASNSGKTKELINLYQVLKRAKHSSHYGITATPNSLLTQLSTDYEILNCGKEDAVAATKSVVEQALFFESLYHNYYKQPMKGLNEFAKRLRFILEMDIDPSVIEKICKAPVLYFAGKNNGVAEELTLKTNEITRKKSVYLEGTYALHGIEEVMTRGEILIIIDPFEQEELKFKEVLTDGVGVEIIAISSRNTHFPTIRIPSDTNYKNYLELAAGWNLLVETGLALGVNLDKPERARKVGNEA